MTKIMRDSLNGRLFFASLLFLLIFLSLTGYALDRAFINSAEMALKDRMLAQLYSLLAVANVTDDRLKMPALLPDPALNRIDSGLVAAIIPKSANSAPWRSPSAVGVALNELENNVGSGETRFDSFDLGAEHYYIYSYGIIWEMLDGREKEFTFNVIQNDMPMRAEIAAFRETLWRWLGAIGVLLLILQTSLLRWGLLPLKALAKNLRQIEAGETDQLAGEYPIELRGVTRNLNLLISHERRQRTKYRDTLADLAHSLKTPLAVMRGLSQKFQSEQSRSGEDLDLLLDEQIERMDEIIRHQLHRAATPGPKITTKAADIAPMVAKLERSLQKVYADKDIAFASHIPNNCQFLGEEQDFLEMLGNLLDNAFKSCEHQVRFEANHNKNNNSSQLVLAVEDDGPGIPSHQRVEVLRRGVRRDSMNPGHGIGLAVVNEIAESYKGSLSIVDSDLGGAKIVLRLSA